MLVKWRGYIKKNDKLYLFTKLVVNTIGVVLLDVTFLYLRQYRYKGQQHMHI